MPGSVDAYRTLRPREANADARVWGSWASGSLVRHKTTLLTEISGEREIGERGFVVF